MVIGMYEFLQNVAKLKTPQERVDALRFNDSVQLRMILQGAFDPSVVWLLPEGDPPYKPNDLVDQQHVLLKDCEKIRYFVRGFHDNLNQTKRERMFVELLERVDPQDAKLLLAIKSKRLPFDGISVREVKEALPGLLPENMVLPEEQPVKAKRVLQNSPKGKKWYHDPEQNVEVLYEEGTQPENWVKGRLPRK